MAIAKPATQTVTLPILVQSGLTFQCLEELTKSALAAVRVQLRRSSAVVADPMQLEMSLPRAVLAPSVMYWLTTVSVTSSAVIPSDVASAAFAVPPTQLFSKAASPEAPARQSLTYSTTYEHGTSAGSTAA